MRLAGGGGGAARVEPGRDSTAVVRLVGLAPGREHGVAAWCGGGSEPPAGAERGSFRTAPEPGDPAPVRFAWGGDIGGQNACRDAARGYPIFDVLAARPPDFWIALGDLIYADDPCLAAGRYGNRQIPGPPVSRATAASFREHWRYNRSDPAYQRLQRATVTYAIWDDHDILNDADPRNDVAPWEPGASRMQPAREAFFDYAPIADRERLHRSFRWGRHLELFILDTRSWRDPNVAPDTGPRPKTLLGADQREWLVRGVAESDATWKLVVSSVPLAIPTGTAARDGWANYESDQGFERELLEILAAWRDAGVRNLVFVTTDVHFATGFRYAPFPGFTLLEFVSGPMNAGVFPKRDVDTTLRPERLFFHGPENPDAIAGYDQALGWFNAGVMEIDTVGRLTVRILNARGDVVFEDAYAPER